MLSRQSLLRVMIGCLALTALAGIAGVFVGEWDLLGRLMGTAVAGAVTAILMLRASAWMDHPPTRRAGLLSMGLSLTIFALVFAAIWVSWGNGLIPGPSSESLCFTALFLGLTGAPAVRFVAALEKPSVRLAAQVTLCIDAVVLALLLAAIWLPLPSAGKWIFGDSAASNLCATAGVLAAHGVVVFACLAGWTRGDKTWWRWTGIVALAIGSVGLIVGIWLNHGGDPTVLFVISSVGVMIAHGNVMLLVPLRAGQRWLRVCTVGATVVTICLVDVLALMKMDQDVFLVRLPIATGILSVCGTLAMIVLARLNRGDAAPPQDSRDVAAPTQLTFTCPVCNKKHTAAAGASACAGCGLLFNLRIEIPRCAACGYVLLHHAGGACPECGGTAGAAPIAQPSTPPPL